MYEIYAYICKIVSFFIEMNTLSAYLREEKSSIRVRRSSRWCLYGIFRTAFFVM